MPITSPGNDDDTGENHQPTLRKNTAEPVEQTLKQNRLVRAPLEAQRLAGLAVDRDDQAPIVAHVRAVRHHRVVFDRRRWDLGPDVPAP